MPNTEPEIQATAMNGVSQRSRKNKQGARESELGLEEQLIVFCPVHAWRMLIPMTSLHLKQTNKDVLLFPSHFPDKETEGQIKFPMITGCNYSVPQTVCPHPGLPP